MKKAVEEAVTTKYYLRLMGVEVSKPSIIYTDNLSAIKNSTDPSSPLKKKYLALSYHFCREHFSVNWKMRMMQIRHGMKVQFYHKKMTQT